MKNDLSILAAALIAAALIATQFVQNQRLTETVEQERKASANIMASNMMCEVALSSLHEQRANLIEEVRMLRGME